MAGCVGKYNAKQAAKPPLVLSSAAEEYKLRGSAAIPMAGGLRLGAHSMDGHAALSLSLSLTAASRRLSLSLTYGLKKM